jgi:hypothetical protein
MSLKERFATYLEAYSAKNLQQVADMFAADSSLRDWTIAVAGKEAAVAETDKNFRAAKTIEIEILATYESDSSIAGELKIVVDRSEVLYVVDVLSFNANGQINSIRAYLSRGALQ